MITEKLKLTELSTTKPYSERKREWDFIFKLKKYDYDSGEHFLDYDDRSPYPLENAEDFYNEYCKGYRRVFLFSINNEYVGYVNFILKMGNYGKITLSIPIEYRERGYGFQIISRIADLLILKEKEVDALSGFVYTHNIGGLSLCNSLKRNGISGFKVEMKTYRTDKFHPNKKLRSLTVWRLNIIKEGAINVYFDRT